MDNSIQVHQKELCNKLWAMANALRGNMEAYEFKNYILGMIFYYYLSDKTEKYMVNLLKDDGISYEEAKEAGSERRKKFALVHMKRFGYFALAFFLYNVVSVLVGVPYGVDITIACVGLVIVAFSTMKIKL